MTSISVASLVSTILSYGLESEAGWSRNGIIHMIYKGVEYTVTAVAPGIWKWQFRVDDKVITGKTEAKLDLLAIRRVQLRIDRELKKAERQ